MAQTRTATPRVVYLRLGLELPGDGGGGGDAAALEALVSGAARRAFGVAGAAALGARVVDVDAAAGSALVQTDAAAAGDLWAALTLLADAPGGAARVTVKGASAHLLALAD